MSSSSNGSSCSVVIIVIVIIASLYSCFKKDTPSPNTGSSNYYSSETPFSRGQVIDEAKKALREAASAKSMSENKINEIIDSMRIQEVIVAKERGVVHATVWCDKVKYMYSIEFNFVNGKMIPSGQYVFDRAY